MRRILSYLFLFSALSMGVISCDSDDGFSRTGINGKPSLVKEVGNGNISFYYEGNRISKIIAENGSTSTFTYKDNELVRVSSTPTDRDIVDGNSSSSFEREGNKIIVESTGDPFFDIFRTEIELNESGFPIKITDAGLYHRTEEGMVMRREPEYFSVLSYDPGSNRLMKEEFFDIKTLESIALYSYEYEDTPGVMSKVDIPAWFSIYWNHYSSYSVNRYNILFLCYANNLSAVKVRDDRYPVKEKEVEYAYRYNDNHFPVRLTSTNIDGGGWLEIQY
ncbi:MAG: hypothetical protein LUH22_13600 [Bacteroides sp.]|nr:hypothetical protein [Bacteroides sp.]